VTSSEPQTNDEIVIRDVIESWARAVRGKDMDGILAHHSPEIVMFDVPPPLQSVGIEAYKKTWDLFFAWSKDPCVFDITELRITAGQEVAFATALLLCSETEKNGDQIDLRFRVTIGLRKIGGSWTVMHEHHSIPGSA
jgi:ketosteroid isomerase-like protein